MRNERLEALLRGIVGPLGYEFCEKYKYPLSAFLSFPEDSAETSAIVSRGLSRSLVQSSLQDILRHDPHLLKCCGDADHLTRTIDLFFIKKLDFVHFPESPALGFAGDRLDGPISEFDRILYEQGQFQKLA